jgi:tRNA_anti-like
MKTLALFLILSFGSLAFADDFKTIEGKEYKNVKVSRVEPDGIVITFSGGIVKIPFVELSPEIQKKYGYDSSAAATYSAQEYEKQTALAQQRKADEQRRFEEREKYWSEHPAPSPISPQQSQQSQQQSGASNMHGSALDRPAYDQSTSAVFLVSQYALNQLDAEKRYTGQTFTISGTIKSIDLSEGGAVTVELFVPGYYVGKAWHMRCIFNDSSGLEKYQAGNPIRFTGTVAGLRRYTLIIKDCHLR